MSQTICAISTASATAAPGIIRISGPETRSVLEEILHKPIEEAGKTEQVFHYTLPDEEDKRAIIVIRKIGDTPKQYPRQPKQIKERPL